MSLVLAERELGRASYALQMLVERPSNILQGCNSDQRARYLIAVDRPLTEPRRMRLGAPPGRRRADDLPTRGDIAGPHVSNGLAGGH